jgi:hypothetical protein
MTEDYPQTRREAQESSGNNTRRESKIFKGISLTGLAISVVFISWGFRDMFVSPLSSEEFKSLSRTGRDIYQEETFKRSINGAKTYLGGYLITLASVMGMAFSNDYSSKER